MNKYQCIKCKKYFKRKANYNRHLNRKYSCNTKRKININNNIKNEKVEQPTNITQEITQVTPEVTQVTQEVTQVTQEVTQQVTQVTQEVTQEVTQVTQEVTQNLPEFDENNIDLIFDNKKKDDFNKIYECSKCGKKFNHRNSFYRHKKHYCKVIDGIIDSKNESYEINDPKNESDQIKSLKEELELMKKEMV